MGCCQSESRHIDADSQRNGPFSQHNQGGSALQGEDMNSTTYEEQLKTQSETRQQQCFVYSSYRRVRKQLSQIHESEPQMEYSVMHQEQSLMKSLKGSPLCHSDPSDDVPSEGSFDAKLMHMFEDKEEIFMLDNQLQQQEQTIPDCKQDPLNTGMFDETPDFEEELVQLINDEKRQPAAAQNSQKHTQEQSTQVVESLNHDTVIEQCILGDCVDQGGEQLHKV